jgi:TRAP-type C4-dicarboxylate transport system permease small subunit
MSETRTAGVTGRKSLLDQLETATLILAGLCIIGVVVVQAWQVFARYVLNDSPSWTEPLALVFIAATATLGAAVGVRRETHFSFPTLADAMPGPIRAVCRTIARLAMLTLGLGLMWFSVQLAASSWSVAMAGAPLPVGARYAPVALGGLLISVFAIERLVRSARGKPPLAAPSDKGEDA